ncbi:Putative serine/threonine-protein kinase C05D10.2, partial [Harpegnathos saltator]
AYGIVWKAIEKKRQDTVAVKKIFDAFRNQTDAQRTFREIMFLLSFANHENIIRLIGLHKANNDRDIYLVFEYMETDLHNVIKRGNILKDIHKVFIMYQLFKAIKYIHSGNVIHRDLKPSNVLLNAQCHCKIADFGLARSVTQIGEGDGETGSDPTLTDYVATRWYRAPEILIASKRFHRRGNEPERGSSVVPLLSDDVQLSVDEYRNKLYAMMDDKHRKHKNMSRSRLRRLSESIRKETAGGKGNLVIGQGDATAVCPSLSNKKTIKLPQGDGTVRVTKARVINASAEAPAQEILTKPQNGKDFATTMSFSLHGAGGRSNQLAAPAPRVKLRKACQQQQHYHHHQQQFLVQPSRPFVSTSANCRGDERPRTMPSKPAKVGDEPKSLKQRSAMAASGSTLANNVTRHFVRTMNGGYLSNPESPYVSQHQQAIRDYLNQTMPLPAQRHSRLRDRAGCQVTDSRGNLDRTSCPVTDVVDTIGGRRAVRGQGGSGLQQRRSVDVGCVVQRKSSTCDKSRFLDSRSQRHGVIAASVYKDLCNGTIGW